MWQHIEAIPSMKNTESFIFQKKEKTRKPCITSLSGYVEHSGFEPHRAREHLKQLVKNTMNNYTVLPNNYQTYENYLL